MGQIEFLVVSSCQIQTDHHQKCAFAAHCHMQDPPPPLKTVRRVTVSRPSAHFMIKMTEEVETDTVPPRSHPLRRPEVGRSHPGHVLNDNVLMLVPQENWSLLFFHIFFRMFQMVFSLFKESVCVGVDAIPLF